MIFTKILWKSWNVSNAQCCAVSRSCGISELEPANRTSERVHIAKLTSAQAFISYYTTLMHLATLPRFYVKQMNIDRNVEFVSIFPLTAWSVCVKHYVTSRHAKYSWALFCSTSNLIAQTNPRPRPSLRSEQSAILWSMSKQIITHNDFTANSD